MESKFQEFKLINACMKSPMNYSFELTNKEWRTG